MEPSQAFVTRADLPITDLLVRWREGDVNARDELISRVYPLLRRIADNRVYSGAGHGRVETTDVVHDAYLRMEQQRNTGWQNRAQFLATVARVTRRTIIDRVRAANRLKRGRQFECTAPTDIATMRDSPDIDYLALDEVLQALRAIDGEAEEVVTLRFFSGMTVPEVAEALNLSVATVNRRWRFARAWLKAHLEG